MLCSFVFAFGQEDHHAARILQFKQMRAIDSTDIVFLGNALVEYAGDWNVLLRSYHIRNRGIAGDDASDIFHLLPTIIKGNPKAIVLMIGGEDIIKGNSVADSYIKSLHVINAIRKELPHTRLFVLSNLPVHGYQNKALLDKIQPMASLNVQIRHYCERYHITYINIFRDFVRRGTNEMRRELSQDGFLLTPFGYKLWAFALRKYLVNL